MKTPNHESNAVQLPSELLEEARKAADEEHRPAAELVSEAVRVYLRARKLPPTVAANPDLDSPGDESVDFAVALHVAIPQREYTPPALTRSQTAGQRIRELRKGVTLGGIPIKELIEEGRE